MGLQRNPLILYLTKADCAVCQEQEKVLIQELNNEANFYPVILIVDLDKSAFDRSVAQFIQDFKTSEANVFIAIDSDTNPVNVRRGTMDISALKTFLASVW